MIHVFFLLQVSPPTPVIDSSFIDQLIAAYNGKAYILLVALVAGALVAMTKGGWFTSWVANKIPPATRPWLALAISEVAMFATETQAGKAWQQVLMDGLMAAAVAVLGHQMGIEGLRGGKEIVPKAPWHSSGSGPAGGAGTGGSPDVVQRAAIAMSQKQTPPSAFRLILGGLVAVGVLLISACGPIGPVPPPVITDFANLVTCVTANMASWQTLLLNCGQWTFAEIEAAIQWLLSNPKFVAEHPDAVDPLTLRLGEVRAKMKAGAK
jgi:hypothetical protein